MTLFDLLHDVSVWCGHSLKDGHQEGSTLSHAQRLCGDKMRVKEEISIRRTGNPMSEGGEVLRRSGHSVNNVEAGIKGPTSEFECVRRSAHHQARSPR